MKGTYTGHGCFGVLVRDPDWVIRYHGQEFGGFGSIYSDHLTWVFMAVERIPFGQVPMEMQARCPVMEVAMGTQILDFQYHSGWKEVKALTLPRQAGEAPFKAASPVFSPGRSRCEENNPPMALISE